MSSPMAPGRPSYATSELTWGLIIAALRRLPHEMAALRAGTWQAFPVGTGLRGKTLGIYGYGRIGPLVARDRQAFRMTGPAWGRGASIPGARPDGDPVARSQGAPV